MKKVNIKEGGDERNGNKTKKKEKDGEKKKDGETISNLSTTSFKADEDKQES